MDAPSKPRHVDVVAAGVHGWIGGPHFDGGFQNDQLSANNVVHVVDEAGEELA